MSAASLHKTLLANGSSVLQYNGGGGTIYWTDDIGGGTVQILSSPNLGVDYNVEDTTTDKTNWTPGRNIRPGDYIKTDLTGSTTPNLKIYYRGNWTEIS